MEVGVGAPVGSCAKLPRSEVVVGEELAKEKYGDGGMVAPAEGDPVLSPMKLRLLPGLGLAVGVGD